MYHFGAIPSTFDARDYEFPRFRTRTIIPQTLDLRRGLMGVRNQGRQSTCVAQAGSCCKEYQERRTIGFDQYLSPQFIYNNRSNYPGIGMSCRDLMRILSRIGVCQETLCVYGDQTMTFSNEIIGDASNFKIRAYARISFGQNLADNIAAVKMALVENGPTVIILPAFNWSVRFWHKIDENDIMMGWHAVAIVGWDLDGFIIRNSWGRDWGDGGYCKMTFDDYNGAIYEHWTMTDDVSNVIVPIKPGCKCTIL